MILSHIVAVSENNVIGKNNSLPWYMPEDMIYFKNTTWGHTVIMGRKNYESEGKALPGRTNIVITRNRNFIIKDGIVVHSISDAIKKAVSISNDEIFIIGGGDIYRQTLNITNNIYLTRIHTVLEGDVFYPEVDTEKWIAVKQKFHSKNKQNPFDFTYYIYQRVDSFENR